MLEAFRKLKLDTPILQQMQDNIERAFSKLVGKTGNPVLDFVRVETVGLVVGSNVIPHKLNRMPRGWWLTALDAAATVHEVTRTASSLTLASTATATVDIYLF